MKYILTLVVIISTTFFATAQTDAQAEQVATKTCECLKTKNFNNKTKSEIEMELGLCMIAEAQKLGIKINMNETDMEKFGEKVGVKMAGICPERFIKYLSAETKDGTTLLDEYNKNDVETQTFEGTFVKMTKEDLLYILLKNKEGREIKTVVLEYFNGVHAIIENAKDYMNKTVVVEYKEIEVYLPRINDFLKIKEVTSLKLK